MPVYKFTIGYECRDPYENETYKYVINLDSLYLDLSDDQRMNEFLDCLTKEILRNIMIEKINYDNIKNVEDIEDITQVDPNIEFNYYFGTYCPETSNYKKILIKNDQYVFDEIKIFIKENLYSFHYRDSTKRHNGIYHISITESELPPMEYNLETIKNFMRRLL